MINRYMCKNRLQFYFACLFDLLIKFTFPLYITVNNAYNNASSLTCGLAVIPCSLLYKASYLL